MRIGFDARLIQETGVGRYIDNLLAEFKTQDKNHEFFIFLKSESFADFKIENDKWHKIEVNWRWHSLKEQLLMPLLLNKYKLDIVHFPYFNVPLLYFGKYIITVHDLIIDHFPTGRASKLPFLVYYLKRLFYKLVMFVSLKRASKILAISESTRKEITDHYGVEKKKIIVTYDSLDKNLEKIKKPDNKIYDFDYLLYVGNAYPHKNLDSLLNLFLDKNIGKKIKLVLAGDDPFFYPRLKKMVYTNNLNNSIVFTGKANNQMLASLYSNSKGLIFPSLMEGFGLPNLEAVYFGCLPVVSDIPVFREIWENDLIYFNPKDSEDMIIKIMEILKMDKKKYAEKIDKARKRLKNYSWSQTAERTLLQYKSD